MTETHVEACHEKPQGGNFFLIPLGSKARKEKWPNYAILVQFTGIKPRFNLWMS